MVISAEKVTYNHLPAMNRSNWIKHPNSNIKPVCHCGVLPLTIKALQELVRNYNKTSKVKWHSVDFNFISIVARVLQVSPTLVISDNSSVLEYDAQTTKIENSDILIKTKYYRFMLELIPYTSDSIRIIKAELVDPKELIDHLSNVVS